MFLYTKNISELAHNIIRSHCPNTNLAIDATLGNGYDTDFLSRIFRKVYAFDIQPSVIDQNKAKGLKNVEYILDSHENFLKYIANTDCIMYNLGFLPGGDKNLTTLAPSTIDSLQIATNILNSNGIISIAIYEGHQEGLKEKEAIMDFASTLPKNKFGVMSHSVVNRENAPSLIIIEKN
ncbi:tRNA (mnm(5)s(2)U34)-methyltransferase [Desnuesiella massiliensis]|uniref:tRNA (mnm(5)s(2)U34)-methyltransferase n=1 Tax=Desnuesiella massiliensis TaxID=1650662 RepID=UPI0006E29FF4|nr:class I SAM-dependent methyltransferase [Desnuesiella massiliensis]